MTQMTQQHNPPLIHAYDPDAGCEGLARVWPDGTATWYPDRRHYGMKCMATDLVLWEEGIEEPLEDEHFWEEMTQCLFRVMQHLQGKAA